MGRRALALLAALAVAIGGAVATAPSPSRAAETFDPGNIIDDALFYDSSAMTAAQIQSFLDGKIGTCQSSDCINILRASVSSRPARVSDTTGNLVCGAFTGGTNLRISDIIYRAQVACGISAKVILVTLQKEQGLVTSKDPSDWNLNYAMGQACPDTAPCDPAYMGIGVQIISGATQLKTYKAANFARQPGIHNIQYSPTASCGTKRVTVKNYATAALYNYTPYTPNDAALRNLYGIGDSCSSYGNRNFWRDYNDWFGSTVGSAPVNSVSSIDTVPHLLALSSTGELWAYPSNGKGGWLPRVRLDSSLSDAARLLAPGDLDGDGHRDLIAITPAGSASHYAGDGALGYADPTSLEVDWSDAQLVTAAGDFSGDGIPDVFTTDTAGSLLLWRGTGTGSLGDPLKVGQGWGGMDLIVGGADFSGDGLLDLVARRADGILMLYKGDGRGGWAGSAKIGNGWGIMDGIFLPGDVSGDGVSDVLANDTAGRLWLYPGTGTGAFRARKQVGNGWQVFTHIVDAGPRAGAKRPLAAGVGDVDGDAFRDIVGLTSAGVIRIYRGNGSGGFDGMAPTSTAVPSGARMLQLGDFDDDGRPDLGYIDAGGLFWLLPGDGVGGYRAAVQIGNGWNIMDAVFGAIDFDGDRRTDVIARDTTGALFVYRGDGNGGWASGGRTQIGQGWGVMTAMFSAGDFDGDGDPDILARRSDSALILYPTDGAGSFLGPRQVGNGWGTMTSIFSPGNFDRSGGPDVVARRTDGILMLYRGDGRGGFVRPAQIGNGWNGMAWIG